MNKKTYRFHALVLPSTLEHLLTSFLKHKDERTEKEKVFSATLPFWLPFAAQSLGGFTTEEVRNFARSSISRLQEHIYYIANTFGLESEINLVSNTYSSQSLESVDVKPLIEEKQSESSLNCLYADNGNNFFSQE